MAVAEGDILEVAAVHLLQGTDEQINVFHFQVGEIVDAGDSGVDGDLVVGLSNAYQALEGLMPNGLSASEIRWRNVTQDTPTRYVTWTGDYDGGTSGVDPLPPAVSQLVLWRTGVKGVSGRTYLPVMTEAQQVNGQLIPLAIVQVDMWATTLWGPWIGDSSGNQYLLKVYSKRLDEAELIINFQARPQLAYMRRRRYGRGS